MKLEHLELKEKIVSLRGFANVNGTNEIGKQLHAVLDFAEDSLNKLSINNVVTKEVVKPSYRSS